jgi:uncharacterized lipoprotein YbaY
MCKPLVRGEIIFDPPPLDLTGAKVTIRLEQSSLADMPSQKVSEQIISDLPPKLAAGQTIPFVVHGPQVNLRERYTLSVHVDLKGDGLVQVGDYINMQSYPVLTFGYPDKVVVQVQQV